MKRNTFIFMLLSGILFVSASCKKTETITPPYPIEGYWVGKYGTGTSTPSAGFSMVVEPGGLLTVADGSNITSSTKAAGTWTLTGSVFKATYTYSGGGATFSIQANWSNTGKLTEGTYGSGSNVTGGGTWFMDRKN